MIMTMIIIMMLMMLMVIITTMMMKTMTTTTMTIKRPLVEVNFDMELFLPMNEKMTTNRREVIQKEQT